MIQINAVPDQIAAPGIQWNESVGVTYTSAVPDVLQCSKVSGPAGLTVETSLILSETCKLRWTPPIGSEGDHYVTLRVTDSRGNQDTEMFKIVVIPN